MKKNQNGVTLIALAVTIIVMLILAGVTMATLTGENGIITQSRRTAAASKEGEVKEKMQTAYNSVIFQVNMDRAGSESYSAQDNILSYLKIIQNSIGASDTTILDTEKQNKVYTTAEEIKNAINGKKYLVYAKDNTIYMTYFDTTFSLTVATQKVTADNKNRYPALSSSFTITNDTEVSPLSGPITSAL